MKNFLIMDFHFGTSLCSKKTLEKLGQEVKIFPNPFVLKNKKRFLFFDAYNYLNFLRISIKRIVKFKFLLKFNKVFHLLNYIITRGQLNYYHYLIYFDVTEFKELYSERVEESLNLILQDKYYKKYFAQFDYLMGSFPPSIFQLLNIIAIKFNKKLFIILGHRFNIWIQTKKGNEKIKEDLKEIYKNKNNILTVGSKYDYEYVKYYLHLNLKKLYFEPFQIKLSKKSKPKKNLILIRAGFEENSKLTSALLNKKYNEYCVKKEIQKKIIFKTIREEFTKGYKFEDLDDYFGFLIVPYSAFSILDLELYRVNIPFFYPSANFIVQNKIDVDRVIYPNYCKKEQYKKMENDINNENSPNNYSPKVKKWVSHFSGFQNQNSIIFDNLDELFKKVTSSSKNFKTISQKMFVENQQRRLELLKEMKKIIQ